MNSHLKLLCLCLSLLLKKSLDNLFILVAKILHRRGYQLLALARVESYVVQPNARSRILTLVFERPSKNMETSFR